MTKYAALIGLVALSLVSCAVIGPAGATGPQPSSTLVEEVRRATRAFRFVARAAGTMPQGEDAMLGSWTKKPRAVRAVPAA